MSAMVRTALTAVVAATVAAGCGGGAEKPSAPTGPVVRLSVHVDGSPDASPWDVEVPLPAPWRKLASDGGIAGIARPYSNSCELFLQITARGTSGSAGRPTIPRKAAVIESGRRSQTVAGQRFDVSYRVAQVGGLAFDGGATGPGGSPSCGSRPDRAATRRASPSPRAAVPRAPGASP
jgi:hypothetical protein